MKVESGKEARQKRLLLVNLREAHALFKEGSKLKVGFSEFASLRPLQVLPMTLRDHEVCMCKYNEKKKTSSSTLLPPLVWYLRTTKQQTIY